VSRLGRVESAGVVVPAHNEEKLLPACLAALRSAAAVAGVPVRLLVVADDCTDETAAVAAACGAEVIRIRARNVGVARAAGMARLLRRAAAGDPAAVWLATTDADTVVPPGWLHRQLGYAAQGWDMVLGTVTVTDWAGYPPHAAALFAAMYGFGEGPHSHVHGANLGIRASAYLAAGGFPPLRTAEDHALMAAATETGCQVLQASDVTVVTSARRHARAPRGFSHALRTLARESGPGGESLAAAGGGLATRIALPWTAMKPRFQCVLTQWKSGFIALSGPRAGRFRCAARWPARPGGRPRPRPGAPTRRSARRRARSPRPPGRARR
jgi:hypothetical protein